MEKEKEVLEHNSFKFREIKVYSSTEWLADNKKKYRQVFNLHDLSYVYAEVSFYNKFFDKSDWEVNIELKCFSMARGRKELCSLPFKRKVSKYDNVFYIREGWGSKTEGTFWKKGTYYWEAWIEGIKVATKYFYIEEIGPIVRNGQNAYLQVDSLRLYEGAYDDVEEGEREYFKEFDGLETRYIYAEIILKNRHPAPHWHCELFAKYYNDARELKGQVVRLQKIERKDRLIKMTAGWGSNVKGSWRDGKYSCEIVFMDKLLAVVPFEVGEEFEEGVPPVYIPDRKSPMMFSTEDDFKGTFEELMERMDSFIGLNEIKKQVRDHSKYIQFLQLRKEVGFAEKDEINVHSAFIGNPGTGKTTIAKMMGKLYRKMGLLSKGHVHAVDRVDLVGEYIGQTGPKVKSAIEKARGGVLFIDEAYSLARGGDDNKDFGREVIEILLKEMSNGSNDFVVIVAGYPKEMKKFLDSNPGLKSRFKLFFEFDDYMPQELAAIAGFACNEKEVRLTSESKAMLDQIIVEAYRNRDRTFGNARFVYDMIEKAKVNLGLRVMSHENPKSLDKESLSLIQVEDVEKIKINREKVLPNIPVDEDLLQESLDELDKLIGMFSVKEQIRELVRLVRFYRETSKDVLNNFSLHTVFVGNPGTGKTTVARILTKIYKALGVLERGHMIETDRQGLVAGYVGQTATKTAEKVDEAMGGVLFIDEAYSLTMKSRTPNGDFGDEAIQTLLKRMEDHRSEFFVFVAGYPDNMESFLKANPGLSSRFDKILKFEDYEPADLSQIALMMLDEKGIVPSPEASEHLLNYLSFLYKYRDNYFGNARTVRQVVSEAIKNQNLRLATMTAEEREGVSASVLAYEDVASFKLDTREFTFSRKRLGFQNQAGQGS
jgi:SpoVK/Ycf46/Vps4 family AAA+-type ATPase